MSVSRQNLKTAPNEYISVFFEKASERVFSFLLFVVLSSSLNKTKSVDFLAVWCEIKSSSPSSSLKI